MRSGVPLLYCARGVRGFGDGFSTIILPAYLTAIGYGPVRIGFVLTVSLLGTAIFTLAVGFIGPRRDLRTLMLAGAAVMALTGLAFPNFEEFAPIVLVAFVGTINPSTGDRGILVPLEQALLAGGVVDEERTRAFSRYSLVGALSTAVGTLAAALPDALIHVGIGRLDALKLMFYAYALLGLVCVALYRRLPPARMAVPIHHAPLGPSRGIVYRLAALFSVDAFAGGFVVQSFMALWLFQQFHLSVTAASIFFFCSGILSALSYPVAARLASRFGLVNTMVFTHIPSSIFLILAALSANLPITLGLLLLRAGLSQMDVPTRTSYVMAVVTPAERTMAASVTAVPRSLASAISPSFAGVLLTNALSGLPLIVCGCLKIIYDFALLYSFRHLKPPEETARTAITNL